MSWDLYKHFKMITMKIIKMIMKMNNMVKIMKMIMEIIM